MPRATPSDAVIDHLLGLVTHLLEEGGELVSAADRDQRLAELAGIAGDISLFSAAAARAQALRRGGSF